MSDLQNIAQLYSRISKLSATNFGRNIFGHIAQPIFTNLQEQEHKRLLEEETDELRDPPELSEKIKTAFFNNFAWGDLLSITGIALLGIQSKLFPPSNNKAPGLIDSIFRTMALGLTFGGSLSALFGRMTDMHRKVALGDKYADARLKAAENRGKKIFTEYSQDQVDKLIEEAKILDKLLIYPKGLKELILERYAKEDIGGLFDGPPGTGKTEGVKCILGKWAQRLRSEGATPVIAELNLANFDDYLKETSRQNAEFMEALQVTAGLDSSANGSIASGEGLLILELLIKKIQRLVNQVNKHNNSSSQKQKLAIFVDEFDKIFDPKTLAGCDKQRLKSLLLQFNELFVKTNILLTSNTSLEDMIKEIKKHLKVGDKNDADEVWRPMYSRLSSKNRSYVDKPARAEQAEIIAARLLDNYRPYLDWKDLGLAINGTQNQELDRRELSQSIKAIIEELNLDLDGRELAYACDDMRSMLLGRARELRTLNKNTIPDEIWDRLNTNERIIKTGSLIDREMIKDCLKTKASSNRLEIYDKDRDLVMNILQNYFSSPKIKQKISSSFMKQELNQSNILNLFSTIFDINIQDKQKTYSSQELVKVDGVNHGFIITRKEAGLHSSGSEPLFKFTLVKKGSDNGVMQNSTRDFAFSELVAIANEAMEQVSGKKNKAVGEVFDFVKTLIKEPNNPMAAVKSIDKLESAVKQLAV